MEGGTREPGGAGGLTDHGEASGLKGQGKVQDSVLVEVENKSSVTVEDQHYIDKRSPNHPHT